MKLDERRLGERGGPDLHAYRVVLLHGDDGALVAERARGLAAVLAARSGLFAPTELNGTEHVRALAELSSPLLGSPGRLVRLREATDAAATSVEAVLSRAGLGVLLIEAGGLPARSRLRGLIEAHPEAASIACRAVDARDLARAVDQVVTTCGARIEGAARALLLEPANGSAVREAEQAALLAGPGGLVTVDHVLAVAGDRAAGPLDDLAFAVTTGSLERTDRLLARLLDDGTAPVAILRALLMHVGWVRVARQGVDAGLDLSAAIASLRPPVFFRRVPDMRGAVASWSCAELDRVAARFWRADRRCRETAAPVEAICREAVWREALSRGGPANSRAARAG